MEASMRSEEELMHLILQVAKDDERVRAVVEKAKEYHVPIRVGVNSGSLEKKYIEKYNGVTAEGLVESALEKVAMIEQFGYHQLAISIKSSDVMM